MASTPQKLSPPSQANSDLFSSPPQLIWSPESTSDTICTVDSSPSRGPLTKETNDLRSTPEPDKQHLSIADYDPAALPTDKGLVRYTESNYDLAIIYHRRLREHQSPPCLQCVLENLPCDRKAPSCARCIRNGNERLCLAQRMAWPDEEGYTYMHVKLIRWMEDEETWREKLDLEEKLLDELQRRLDILRWVLPDSVGKRGGYTRRCLHNLERTCRFEVSYQRKLQPTIPQPKPELREEFR